MFLMDFLSFTSDCTTEHGCDCPRTASDRPTILVDWNSGWSSETHCNLEVKSWRKIQWPCRFFNVLTVVNVVVWIQQRFVVVVEKFQNVWIPAVCRQVRQQLTECLHLTFVVFWMCFLILQDVEPNDSRIVEARRWRLRRFCVFQNLHFVLVISCHAAICGEMHDRWIYLFQVCNFCRNF